MQSVINKYRRYDWVAVTFVVMLHMMETILCQTNHHKSLIYLCHFPIHLGGTIIWEMVCHLLTYHIITWLLFYYSLSTSCWTTPPQGPLVQPGTAVPTFSILAMVLTLLTTLILWSSWVLWVFESVLWINQHSWDMHLVLKGSRIHYLLLPYRRWFSPESEFRS